MDSYPWTERTAAKVRRRVSHDTPQARMNWRLALAMWDEGKNTHEIAQEFEVAESFIYNFLPRSERQKTGK